MPIHWNCCLLCYRKPTFVFLIMGYNSRFQYCIYIPDDSGLICHTSIVDLRHSNAAIYVLIVRDMNESWLKCKIVVKLSHICNVSSCFYFMHMNFLVLQKSTSWNQWIWMLRCYLKNFVNYLSSFVASIVSCSQIFIHNSAVATNFACLCLLRQRFY